jgi:hypothetical protein
MTTKSDNISRATSRGRLGTEDELSSTEGQVHSHKHQNYWRQEDICWNVFHVTLTNKGERIVH